MKKKKKLLSKKIDAFNMQELLVVLVIIGILILIALPNLMPIVSKAKALEAQTNLSTIYSFEKNYFFMHSKYTNNFNDIDYLPNKTVKEGGTANYEYEIIEATNNSFKAKAIAVTDFDGDGILNVWEIDENKNLKEVIKD
ncbi:prepilin-type N-terminal cleavage/methylation domain-containing protein [Polaribacter sp. Asnod6-C07]|uniref:prepilin-type N-terminal cleavage/methylation domain-containing protein n=1 Tax=Polaribacter sp. Asnod6-C07 TaxID=3160582 RepID=UPI0038633642